MIGRSLSWDRLCAVKTWDKNSRLSTDCSSRRVLSVVASRRVCCHEIQKWWHWWEADPGQNWKWVLTVRSKKFIVTRVSWRVFWRQRHIYGVGDSHARQKGRPPLKLQGHVIISNKKSLRKLRLPAAHCEGRTKSDQLRTMPSNATRGPRYNWDKALPSIRTL